MRSYNLLFFNMISWIFLSKKMYLVFLMTSLKFFQSAIVMVNWYIFSLVLHSLFHYVLEILYLIESEIFAYSWIISLRDSLLDISKVLIFPMVFISSMSNFSSSLLFLIIVHHLSWINSSLINMSTVNGAWFERLWDSGKIKWLLISTELGHRNIRLITEFELLGLSVYWVGTWLTGEESFRSKESATSIRISLYAK